MNQQSNETSRQLQQVPFAPSSLLIRELPLDTVLKGLQLRLSGAVRTTFGSGTPVSNAESIFDNLVNRIDVVIDGGTTVKSVKPHMMRMQQLFTSTVLAERRASAAAAAAAQPSTDQGFVFGTTTQYTTVAETLLISFEMVYAEPTMGRETTWLNLKRASSAEIRFTTNAYSGLQGFGNTAPVTYDDSTLVIDIFTIEARAIPKDVKFAIWKQSVTEYQIGGETNDYGIQVTGKNKLTGIMLFVRDGAAGSATTASGKLASDLAITKINLKANGQNDQFSGTFKGLQAKNRLMYGVNAPVASGVSLISGVCHLNLLDRRDLSTALDMKELDSLYLYLSTNNSTNVSYTNPVNVSVQVEEVIIPA